MKRTITSLRDRHRQEVSAALHEAACQHAVEHGLDGMRTEDVARAAGVSRRTFFNYFATKEDAVLGLVAPHISDEARQTFFASDRDILSRTAHLSLEAVRSMAVTNAPPAQRRQLRQRFPALHARFHWHMAKVDELVRPLVLHACDGDEQVADVVLNLASAVLRDAYRTNLEVTHRSVEQSTKKFKLVLEKVL